MAELAYACNEDEADIVVHRLEHGEECLQRITIGIMQRFVVDSTQKRLVILVHQHNHLTACLLVSAADDSLEAQLRIHLGRTGAINPFPLGKLVVQEVIQICHFVILANIQVQVEHGIRLPLRLQLLDGQSLEQIFLSLEVRLQSRDRQRLAETAWAAEEVTIHVTGHLVNKGCLVYVNITICAQLLEALYSYGVLHHDSAGF